MNQSSTTMRENLAQGCQLIGSLPEEGDKVIGLCNSEIALESVHWKVPDNNTPVADLVMLTVGNKSFCPTKVCNIYMSHFLIKFPKAIFIFKKQPTTFKTNQYMNTIKPRHKLSSKLNRLDYNSVLRCCKEYHLNSDSHSDIMTNHSWSELWFVR